MRNFIPAGVLTATLSACFSIIAAQSALAQEALPWSQNGGQVRAANDAYGAQDGDGSGDVYRPNETYRSGDTYSPPDNYRPGSKSDSFSDPAPRSAEPRYGDPYAEPRAGAEPYDRDYGSEPPPVPRQSQGYYEQGEIVGAGHRFFGSISQGLASAVEYAFKSQGRPNGYILGEDAGGAFVVGLRYGEGRLYTKDAGTHPVYWQGPSVGYDAGAEGSKTMVLVYNLRDPSDIYRRYGGVQGAAYLVGGVSVQFQKYGDVNLAVIRSGVGLRLGANVGYLKYTRSPTWNPL